MVCRRKSLYLQVETKCLIEKNKIDMREKIEALMAEIAGLKNLKEQEIEALRVRLLGKKGEITALFDEFRTVAPEMKREFGQKLNVLKQAATSKIEELKSSAESEAA